MPVAASTPVAAQIQHPRRPGSSGSEEVALATYFFDNDPLYFSFIHRETHLARIGNDMCQASISALRFGFCLLFLSLAICATGALLAPDELAGETSQGKAATWYYEKARELALSSLDYPSLEAVQALLLLAHVARAADSRAVAWQMLGLASRMCQYLHLDTDPDEIKSLAASIGWVEKETRRRCWWASYILDQNAVQMAGWSPVLSSSSHRVKLLCREELWTATPSPDTDEGDGGRDHVANHFVMLVGLSAAVQATLRRTERSAEFAETVRQEDDALAALEAWRQTVPLGCWLWLDDGAPLSVQRATMLLLYHGLVCALLQRRVVLFLRHLARELPISAAAAVASRHHRHRRRPAARRTRAIEPLERAYSTTLESVLAAAAVMRAQAGHGTGDADTLRRARLQFRPPPLLRLAMSAVLVADAEALRAAQHRTPPPPPPHTEAGAEYADDDGVDDGSMDKAAAAAASAAGHHETVQGALAAAESLLAAVQPAVPDARLLLALLAAARRRDWHALAAVERDPGQLYFLRNEDGGGVGGTGGGGSGIEGAAAAVEMGAAAFRARRWVSRLRLDAAFLAPALCALRELHGVELEPLPSPPTPALLARSSCLETPAATAAAATVEEEEEDGPSTRVSSVSAGNAGLLEVGSGGSLGGSDADADADCEAALMREWLCGL
ncbi:hypothetical protein HK405_013075 [Cladochytrium tenue]|nr:hypothetical protein HK405_013075 [Cladochytrium tenue]